MSQDLQFDEIMKKLQTIHEEFPDLRFGDVLQTAVDNHKRAKNTNIFDLSSKEINTALESFQNNTRRKRGKQ